MLLCFYDSYSLYCIQITRYNSFIQQSSVIIRFDIHIDHIVASYIYTQQVHLQQMYFTVCNSFTKNVTQLAIPTQTDDRGGFETFLYLIFHSGRAADITYAELPTNSEKNILIWRGRHKWFWHKIEILSNMLKCQNSDQDL